MRNPWFVLCFAAGLLPAAVSAQSAHDIALDPPIECWYHSQFPMLGAEVVPPEEIVRARLYFRCSLYPDYYFIDLTSTPEGFTGVAPQAEESCPSVHYYVEAVSADFSSSRTEERTAEVTSENECRRRNPAAAWFTGEDPRIVLGSTVAGPELAPGFKSLGITGFISSTGVATAVAAAEGGLSAGAVAGIAAAGAGAVGVGVAASGGSGGSATTTSPVGGGPPPSPTTTTMTTTVAATTSVVAAPAVTACFTLDPPSGIVDAREPLTIDGRCSTGTALRFRFDLGDGRVKEGQPFITAVWSTPGTYNLSLTVIGESTSLVEETDTVTRQITVERAAEPVSADFVARGVSPNVCIGVFDGSPSTGDIVEYLWELDLDNAFRQGVKILSGQVVQYDWDESCYRTEGVLRARLTVRGADGSSSSVVKTVNILGLSRNLSTPLESAVVAEMLEVEGEAAGALVLPNGAGATVSSGTPTVARFAGRAGANVIEAVLQSASGSVLWRFDFSGTPGYVPGSARTLSGQEVSRDSHSVVLRFSGATGERARIEVELAR